MFERVYRDLVEKLKFYIYWFIIRFSRFCRITRWITDRMALFFYKTLFKYKTFIFKKNKYYYFYHLYNRTFASERVVEIPIVKKFVDDYNSDEVLEVGNVLSHYFPVKHDVLDKYEKSAGVINRDVVNFSSTKKYKLIVSISTMEHVGWSYGEKKEPNKFLTGLKNLKNLLLRGGKIIVTFPLFYRDDLNKLIKENKGLFTREFFLKRTSFLNEWKEVNKREAFKGKKYDSYYANANVLFIGIYKK